MDEALGLAARRRRDTPKGSRLSSHGGAPRLDACLGGEGAIKRFRRRGDTDAMDEVGRHGLC